MIHGSVSSIASTNLWRPRAQGDLAPERDQTGGGERHTTALAPRRRGGLFEWGPSPEPPAAAGRPGSRWERGLSARIEQFRQEMREFFTTAIPEEIPRRRTGEELTKDDIATTHRALHAAGMAVCAWPVEWGGRTGRTSSYLWFDELPTRRVPAPLAFNANMIGLVIAAFGSAEMKARFLPPTAALDIWWCQGYSEARPAATSPRCARRRSATAMSTSSTDRRRGPRSVSMPDWIFVLVRTDLQAPKPQQGISMFPST